MAIVSHVIFDLDGLLLDTESVYTKITQLICDPYGKVFTWDIKLKMMGKKEDEAAKIFIKELEIPISDEDYKKQIRELLIEHMPRAPVMPGAERLVQHLHKHNIPIAIATGTDKFGYDLKVSRHENLFKLFSHVVLSSDDPEVKNGKPAPDCFLVAAKRFPDSPPPSKCLVFEDAPNGAESGLAAGMHVVWVPDANVDSSMNGLNTRVHQHLKTLADFNPKDFGLPPYDT